MEVPQCHLLFLWRWPISWLPVLWAGDHTANSTVPGVLSSGWIISIGQFLEVGLLNELKRRQLLFFLIILENFKQNFKVGRIIS